MSTRKTGSLKPLKDRTVKDVTKGAREQMFANLRKLEESIASSASSSSWAANGFYGTALPPLADRRSATEALNTYAMTPADPTSAEIREVAVHLRTLADTFPGVIHAANGPGLSGSPMNTMGALDRACEMLRQHANDVQDRETEREKQRSESKFHDMMATLERTRGDGITIGIAQEQARAKEARKGRRGAKNP